MKFILDVLKPILIILISILVYVMLLSLLVYHGLIGVILFFTIMTISLVLITRKTFKIE